MKDLIKALQIFLKYGNPVYPTHCEHDSLYVVDFNVEDISEADVKELDNLGFFWSEEDGYFLSYKFGSA